MAFQMLHSIAFVSLALMWLPAEDVKVQKSFESVKNLHVRVGSSDCVLAPSQDGKVHVELVSNYSREVYEPQLTQDGTTLTLGERFSSGNTRGHATWHITIPEDLKVDVTSGSGGLTVQGVSLILRASHGSGKTDISRTQGELVINAGSGSCKISDSDNLKVTCNSGSGGAAIQRVKGKLRVNSGSGGVELSECEGDAALNVGSARIRILGFKGNVGACAGSGSIIARNLTLQERGTFSAGSGSMEVDMPTGQGFRLVMTTGSGSPTVNLNGRAPEGTFEFYCNARSGRIVSSEKFDTEDEFEDPSNGNRKTQRKVFKRGTSTTQVIVKTGSGTVELRR